MMIVNRAYSVSEALRNGLHHLRVLGVRQESRVGDVIVSPHPVMTIYSHPTHRVLFSPMRDANPFFHVMEALWMISGRNDLPWLTRYNKRFEAYSDDGGKTQPGAYGYRWRYHFGYDQLPEIIEELRRNPKTRRCVLTMWDATGVYENDKRQWPGDLVAGRMGTADAPCNTHAYFDTTDERLNMTVCCRSNDIIWGAHGANAVHFSFLLEYISAMTGIPMGVYRQFSNNYHIYTNIVPEAELMVLAREVESTDKYRERDPRGINLIPASIPLRNVPLVGNPETFDSELSAFMEEINLDDTPEDFMTPFFRHVAYPMKLAWAHYKQRDYDRAIEAAHSIRSEDWSFACEEWLVRRRIKMEQNQSRFTDVVEMSDIVEPTNTFNQEV